jgi:hypothetical protein
MIDSLTLDAQLVGVEVYALLGASILFTTFWGSVGDGAWIVIPLAVYLVYGVAALYTRMMHHNKFKYDRCRLVFFRTSVCIERGIGRILHANITVHISYTTPLLSSPDRLRTYILFVTAPALCSEHIFPAWSLLLCILYTLPKLPHSI